jgi:hypothetical protein
MLKSWRSTVVVLSLVCLGISCSKSTKHEDFEISPWAYEEAKLMALCLSGELEAPDDLYNRVLRELAAIRSAFGDDFQPITRLTFHPPWLMHCLTVWFDDTTAQKVAGGEYHAWDELNERYHVARVDTHAVGIGFAKLYFKETFHPRRLAEQYAPLPGVSHAEPNGFDGDWPNVYPRQAGSGITYLFRYAYGDCMGGCIYNEYWYFVFEGDRPVFVGHWIPYESQQEPYWWKEASLNRQLYRGF